MAVSKLININDIRINSGWREIAPEDVKRLSESIAEIGMTNLITGIQTTLLPHAYIV